MTTRKPAGRIAFVVSLGVGGAVFTLQLVHDGLHGSVGLRPAIRLERWGSMDVEDVRALLDRFDLGLEIAPTGKERLQQRTYDFRR